MIGLGIVLALMTPCGLGAQVRQVDPNGVIREEAARQTPTVPATAPLPAALPEVRYRDPISAGPDDGRVADDGLANSASAADAQPGDGSATYKQRDLIGAAEAVFGKGAAGLGGILEKILQDQGQPNAYIAGREASAAILVGVRYGSGVMTHKIEGERPIYWTGPSVGFDAGGNASKVFVLAYNLYDSQDIYRRFPEAEGHLYLVGGFSATYLRRGKIVLIPIRLGVGLRAGVNIGYMKFSQKAKWVPF